jgi:protein-S-isoprenylcysteine O-methyltransferase Ste14
MYGGALVMMLGTPFAPGSWWGLLVFVLMVVVIARRALAEEAFLSHNLPGYDQYCLTVLYRLAPLIW